MLTAVFLLAGQRFMALDGGPVFRFTEAVSMYVDCSSQAMLQMKKLDISALKRAHAG